MSNFDVDRKLIRDLAKLLQEEGLSEIEIVSDKHRLRVARQVEPVYTTVSAAPAAAAALAAQPATAATGTQAAAGGNASDGADLSNHPGAVHSPMPGTAYRGPEPGAPPFVNVGDTVTQGQTVMIIEAMKTFNEIPAPHSGTITQILVDNTTPLEYGDVLMIIE